MLKQVWFTLRKLNARGFVFWNQLLADVRFKGGKVETMMNLFQPPLDCVVRFTNVTSTKVHKWRVDHEVEKK